MYTLRADGRYMGYWHDKDGKRHAIYDTDPEKLYQKIQAKETPAPNLFSDVAEAWADERFPMLSYKSVEAYKPTLKRIVERFGDRELDAIETIDVNAFLSWLAGRQYAKRTVQMHRDITSQIFNYAIAHQMTRYNPCDHAAMPRGLSQGTRGIPTDDAIEAVKSRVEHPFALFALICLYSGLRRGEALALRYEDVDKKNKCIRVDKSVVFVGNNPQLKSTKTESSTRSTVLVDALAAMIPDGKGFIFCDKDGQLLTKEAYNWQWESYCKYLGYKVTAHQLRHGFATLIYEADIPERDRQELLGHSDITITENIYTHIRSSRRQKISDQLNDYVVKNAVKTQKSVDK